MSHINTKRWRRVEELLVKIGIATDFKRNHDQPYPRGMLVARMTPQRMAYRVMLGGGVRLWWNGQEVEVVQEAIAFLQMLDHKNITVLR